MRLIRPWLLLSLAALACTTHRDRPQCDRQALVSLSQALGDSGERAQRVWQGLEAACGSALPAGIRAHYLHHSASASDSTLAAMKARACPGWAETVEPRVAITPLRARNALVYEACGLEGHDLSDVDLDMPLDSGGIVTWAVHQWLLDQQLESVHAAAIAAALFEREHASPAIRLLPGQSWPRTSGEPLGDGVILHVSLDAIALGERTLVDLRGGALDSGDVDEHRIVALSEALSGAVPEDPRNPPGAKPRDVAPTPLLLAADAGVPFTTLVDVIYTAGKAGFGRYGFVISTVGERGDELAQITIDPPSPRVYMPQQLPRSTNPEDSIQDVLASMPKRPPMMTLELGREGLSVARSDRPARRVELQLDDHAAITAYAAALHDDDPHAQRLLVSAAPSVRIEDLLVAVAAARGPECGPPGVHCQIADVTVFSADAHRFGASAATPLNWPYPIGGDDDDVWRGLVAPETVAQAYGLDGHAPQPIAHRSSPRIRQAKATVDGPLDRDVVRRIVRAHIPELMRCYGAALADDPRLHGRVVIDFVIRTNGEVGRATLGERSIAKGPLTTCMVRAARDWRFPKSASEVRVSHPFLLEPGEPGPE